MDCRVEFTDTVDPALKTAVKRSRKIKQLFNTQAGQCAYCRQPMTLCLGHEHTATIDHVVPKSKGGSPTCDFNQVAACYSCNMRKADMPLAEFLSVLFWNNEYA